MNDEEPEDAPAAERIRAEDAEVGDLVAPLEGYIEPFTITRTRADGGALMIYGGEKVWAIGRRDWIWRLLTRS